MNVAVKTYNRTCRACLCLVPQNTTEYKINANVSSEMFTTCTSVQVTEQDPLPKLLCGLCYETLLKVHEFRGMCSRSHTLLQSIITNSDIRPEFSSLSNYIFTTDSPPEIETKLQLSGSNHLGEIAAKVLSIDNTNNSSDSDRKSVISKKEKLSRKCKKLQKKPRPPSKIQEKDGHHLACDQCSRKYDYPERLEAHKLTFHQNKRAVIKCATCGKEFKAWQTFRQHKRSTHESINLADLKCGICGKVYKTHMTLYNHKRRHHVNKSLERRFTCHICGQKVATQNYLSAHIETHNQLRERSFVCTFCDKKFYTSALLKTHVTDLHGSNSFTCDHCQTAFSRKKNLIQHIRTIHLGVKPYTCDFCSKTFVSSGAVRQHTRVHTGERPYPCGVCAKRFASRPQLVNHTRIHTGEKPYTCKMCNKSFIQRSTLVRHFKVHNK